MLAKHKQNGGPQFFHNGDPERTVRALQKELQAARARIAKLSAQLASREPVAANRVTAGSIPKCFFESFSSLTHREREVLSLFMEQPSDKKVANRLGTHLRTVRNQLVSIMHKLGVNSRAELVAESLLSWVKETRRAKARKTKQTGDAADRSACDPDFDRLKIAAWPK